MHLTVSWTRIIVPAEGEIIPEGSYSEDLQAFGKALEEHIASYKNEIVRQSSVTAWLLLKSLLDNRGEPVREVSFTEKGKPFFADGSGLFFSLSHTRYAAAAAVCDMPVGVDIEQIREEWKSALLARFLTKKEQQVFQDDYTRAWCRKEAQAKLTGEGMFQDPKQIDILSDEYVFEEKIVEDRGVFYRLTAAAKRDI